MDKTELMVIFKEAIDVEAHAVYVKISKEGFKGHEVIVNPNENIEDMMDYYDNVYDEDLVHKYSNVKIRIVDADYFLNERIEIKF